MAVPEMAVPEMAGPEMTTQTSIQPIANFMNFFYVFLVGILKTTVHHLVHLSRLVDYYQSFHGPDRSSNLLKNNNNKIC